MESGEMVIQGILLEQEFRDLERMSWCIIFACLVRSVKTLSGLRH